MSVVSQPTKPPTNISLVLQYEQGWLPVEGMPDSIPTLGPNYVPALLAILGLVD